MKPGEIIQRRWLEITQAQIDAWGELAGIGGAIHSDPEYAASTPLGGVIAQGMLVLAPLHNIMLELVGQKVWHTSGRLSAKLVNVTRPGDSVTYEIAVQACSDRYFLGDYRCIRSDGMIVAVGTVSSQGAGH